MKLRFQLLLVLGIHLFFHYDANAQSLDVKILQHITDHRNLKYESLQNALSFSVYPALVALPAGVFTAGLIHKNKEEQQVAISIAAGIALNIGVTYGLKYTVQRNRPYIDHSSIQPLVFEDTYSFPSGHTSSAFNVATSLVLNYPKWYVAVPAFAWASSVGYSRMYLGVHYPSDVIGGVLVGSSTAWLSYYLNQKIKKNKQKKAIIQ